MILRTEFLVAVSLFGFVATGCGGGEGCDAFAEHLADVATKEAGKPVDADLRAKMIKKTVDSCNADPPSKEVLDCAMKAETSKAMKACEGGEEEAKAEPADGEAKADAPAGDEKAG